LTEGRGKRGRKKPKGGVEEGEAAAIKKSREVARKVTKTSITTIREAKEAGRRGVLSQPGGVH